MTETRLLDLVDACDFRTLFIDELGWQNPDRPPLTFEVDGCTYTLTQVAGYKGLRIWHCPTLPPRPIQREIDVLVGKDNLERLVIFTDKQRQEWRWPRRKQLGSTNAKLVVHQHIVGDRATHLTERLRAIELDFDEDLPLVTLLERMRDAFDREAESASVAAARLMGTLYTHLEDAGVGEHDATLLLARLLFLFFGDDADMWKPA
ncbi:class I SAM-dependent DNA methyltransferase, partial [Mycobacteroides abscessus]